MQAFCKSRPTAKLQKPSRNQKTARPIHQDTRNAASQRTGIEAVTKTKPNRQRIDAAAGANDDPDANGRGRERPETAEPGRHTGSGNEPIPRTAPAFNL